jgi:hypothetical protein
MLTVTLFILCIMIYYISGSINKSKNLQSMYSLYYLASTYSGLIAIFRELTPKYHENVQQ